VFLDEFRATENPCGFHRRKPAGATAAEMMEDENESGTKMHA